MTSSKRKMTKSQRRNLDNHYTIFASYRCVEPGKEKRFMAVPHRIIHHIAFTSMRPLSKLLYFYMTDYAEGKQEFTYPRRIYKNLMSLQTFQSARQELIEHGFIKITSEGGLFNNEAIYKFIGDWREYKPIQKKKRKNNITKKTNFLV